MLLLLIVAELVPDEKSNEQRGGNAQRKSTDFNGGIGFLADKIAPGNFDVELERFIAAIWNYEKTIPIFGILAIFLLIRFLQCTILQKEN